MFKLDTPEDIDEWHGQKIIVRDRKIYSASHSDVEAVEKAFSVKEGQKEILGLFTLFILFIVLLGLSYPYLKPMMSKMTFVQFLTYCFYALCGIWLAWIYMRGPRRPRFDGVVLAEMSLEASRCYAVHKESGLGMWGLLVASVSLLLMSMTDWGAEYFESPSWSIIVLILFGGASGMYLLFNRWKYKGMRWQDLMDEA